MFSLIARTTGFEFPDLRNGNKTAIAKTLARDFVYGVVGLFVLDVSWRTMDVLIDFICSHVHFLAWLGD